VWHGRGRLLQGANRLVGRKNGLVHAVQHDMLDEVDGI
jgi:hypothetical protein